MFVAYCLCIVRWTCICNSSSSALKGTEVWCIALMQQQFVVTLRYTIFM